MNDDDLESKEAQRKSEIPQASSKVLAAHVVVYRTLGIEKDFAIACMEELVRRRAAGDDFDYEVFIDEEVKKIPKIDDESMAALSRQIHNINAFKGAIKK